MKTNHATANAPNDFRIIFEKLNEVQKEDSELFMVNQTLSPMSEEIKGIKEIVEACSIEQHYQTLTSI